MTVYENVDEEFLGWYLSSGILPDEVPVEDFKNGKPFTCTSQDPEGQTEATTTWQLIDEEKLQ